MSRPETTGFRKPTDTGRRREVKVAMVRYAEDGSARCSCGQPFVQRREKVREDAVDRHIKTKHNGQGFRL